MKSHKASLHVAIVQTCWLQESFWIPCHRVMRLKSLGCSSLLRTDRHVLQTVWKENREQNHTRLMSECLNTNGLASCRPKPCNGNDIHEESYVLTVIKLIEKLISTEVKRYSIKHLTILCCSLKLLNNQHTFWSRTWGSRRKKNQAKYKPMSALG